MKKFTLALLFALMLAGGIAMFLGNTEVSLSERRQLTRWSDVTNSRVLTGALMTKAEDAAMDQFPFRDAFRRLKANFLYKVMGKLDNNGIYVHDGSAAKLEYPLNEPSIQNAISKILNIRNTYLRGTQVNAYYCVIPDKNYYLAQELGYPTMDYDRMDALLAEELPMTGLSISSLLDAQSYYATDPHWDQEKIIPVAEYLTESMGVPFCLEGVTLQTYGTLSGAYTGQSALPLRADTLTYWSGPLLEGCKAYDLSNGAEIPIYDYAGAESNDPYNFFLGGAAPLQVIENPNCPNDRELIIFRDSFGSSIAPLFSGSYSRVTLVDLRYAHSSILGQYIQFTDQDVLFLYSTLILNQSSTLR